MMGALISDDFYFFFEDKDIEALSKHKRITGQFAAEIQGEVIGFTLFVKVYRLTLKHINSDIGLGTNKPMVTFEISEDHFKQWFIEKIPCAWRWASINVYVDYPGSEDAISRQKNLEAFVLSANYE